MSAIKLDEERCSKCGICYSVCPFDAISFENGSKIKIDIEKCQLCGMCSTGCPSSTIEPAYYNYDLLVEEVRRKREELGAENLVLMCRGACLSCDELNVLKDISNFIPLRLPCIGRIKTEFYLKMLTMGIKKIAAIQCSEDVCRYKKGSRFNKIRLLELKELLKQIGSEDVFMVIENPQRIEYDPEKCIGCDKCVYVCPYDAIEAKPLSTPYIHASKCKACGLCTVICPHLAMQIKDFESEQINSAIMEYGSRLKELKEKGKPVILVFCCQWAEFPALDRVENGFLKENAAIIEIPCFSALDPVHVLQALNIGFDGVLAIVCSDDDCKARESRDFVEEGIRTLKFALKKLNLDGKFVIRKTHPRYMERFEEKLEFFLEVLANG